MGSVRRSAPRTEHVRPPTRPGGTLTRIAPVIRRLGCRRVDVTIGDGRRPEGVVDLVDHPGTGGVAQAQANCVISTPISKATGTQRRRGWGALSEDCASVAPSSASASVMGMACHHSVPVQDRNGVGHNETDAGLGHHRRPRPGWAESAVRRAPRPPGRCPARPGELTEGRAARTSSRRSR